MQNLENSRFDMQNLEISRFDMQNLEHSKFDVQNLEIVFSLCHIIPKFHLIGRMQVFPHRSQVPSHRPQLLSHCRHLFPSAKLTFSSRWPSQDISLFLHEISLSLEISVQKSRSLFNF